MAESDSLLRDLELILCQEAIPPEELRDRVVVPLLNRLGHPDNLIVDHPAGDPGADLLVRDRAGEPLISVGCRKRSSSGLVHARPVLHNSLMRQAKTPLGILADGRELEVWEMRGKTPVRLTAWPPDEARARASVLREIAMLDESVQCRLRGQAPPELLDPRLPEIKAALGRHLLVVPSLVSFELKSRFGALMQSLLERASPPAGQEETAKRVKDGYRRWATSAENGLLLYLAMTARVAALRMITSLVLETRDRREGAPAFPDGKGGAAMRSVERLRRQDPSLYGGGVFDWYLPEDSTHDTVRRLLAAYRIGELDLGEVRELARGEAGSQGGFWGPALARVLPEGVRDALWVAATGAGAASMVMSAAHRGSARLPSAWHVRSLGRTVLSELRLEAALLGMAPPSTLGLLNDQTPACDVVVVEPAPFEAPAWNEVPHGRIATVVLLGERETPRALLTRFAAAPGGTFLFELAGIPGAPADARMLVKRSDGVVPEEADGMTAIHLVRGLTSLDQLEARPFKAIAAPLARVLWGRGGKPDFGFDPVVEGVVERLQSGARPLSEIAELEEGHPADEVVLGTTVPRDPLARRAIGPGRDLGRFWICWSDKWWVPPSAEHAAEPADGQPPAILVRWDRGRLYAAWDATGFEPVGAVVRLVPRLGAGDDPRLVVGLLNASWASVYVHHQGAPPERRLGDALAKVPIRLPPRAQQPGWLAALDGIERANQSIQKAMERLASIDRLAQEAWVRRVPLRDATGTLLSHRVPPVLEVAGPLVREENEVRIGDDLVLTARSPEVARLIHALLETEVRRLVGHSGVEIERMFQVPRTEAEAKLLLAVLDRLHAEIDEAVSRRAGWEADLEARSLALYGITPEDLRILAGPGAAGS
ncbi:MAG: hypothetical protein U0610_25790 [bacterium]